MNRRVISSICFIAVLGLALPSRAQELPAPLVNAHAHNDYNHERPLLDALDHGFCSVEADVWLVENRLFVAHNRDGVDPARTLESLYLEPLRDRVRANGGRVYPGGTELILLIDIKSDGESTFAALLAALKRYPELFTTYSEQGGLEKRAVRAVLSGNRPRAAMEAEATIVAAYDGRLDDIGGGASPAFMPLISANWRSVFEWIGDGPMPPEERERLGDIVRRSHAEGKKVRFWATPHKENLWDELDAAGVDLINADDLGRLQRYLLRKVR